MAPPKVTQWVNENFPKPRVDPVSTRQVIIRIGSRPTHTGMVGRLLRMALRKSTYRSNHLFPRIYTSSQRPTPTIRFTRLDDAWDWIGCPHR